MKDACEILDEALRGAEDDGRITAADFDDWKGFKKSARKRLRKLFKRVEDEGVDVDADDALLARALLARLCR